MNGRSQMQGGKNWILPKRTGLSKTLIGWKSGKTTYVPLWDRKERAWLWTQYMFMYREMVKSTILQ
jgi:hypothetical protein